MLQPPRRRLAGFNINIYRRRGGANAYVAFRIHDDRISPGSGKDTEDLPPGASILDGIVAGASVDGIVNDKKWPTTLKTMQYVIFVV